MLRDLRGLSKDNSEFVGRHLVAATTLADDEPDAAWLHARAARSKGGRIAVVRETVGLVAYRAEEWAEAISELRAARRMGGGPGHVAILADCERALGNPERALDLARSPEAAQLDPDGAAELRIVAAGARSDLGQLDAALALLQDGDGFDLDKPQPYSARLYYAYADLLLTAGRADEALQWFVRADDADDDGETDADERIADLIMARDGGADSLPADSDAESPDGADLDESGPAGAGLTDTDLNDTDLNDTGLTDTGNPGDADPVEQHEGADQNGEAAQNDEADSVGGDLDQSQAADDPDSNADKTYGAPFFSSGHEA